MSENPNPRGWRIDNGRRSMFFDLERVEFVCRLVGRDGDFTQVVFVNREEGIDLTLSDKEHNELLNALEIYRSGR